MADGTTSLTEELDGCVMTEGKWGSGGFFMNIIISHQMACSLSTGYFIVSPPILHRLPYSRLESFSFHNEEKKKGAAHVPRFSNCLLCRGLSLINNSMRSAQDASLWLVVLPSLMLELSFGFPIHTVFVFKNQANLKSHPTSPSSSYLHLIDFI